MEDVEQLRTLRRGNKEQNLGRGFTWVSIEWIVMLAQRGSDRVFSVGGACADGSTFEHLEESNRGSQRKEVLNTTIQSLSTILSVFNQETYGKFSDGSSFFGSTIPGSPGWRQRISKIIADPKECPTRLILPLNPGLRSLNNVKIRLHSVRTVRMICSRYVPLWYSKTSSARSVMRFRT